MTADANRPAVSWPNW